MTKISEILGFKEIAPERKNICYCGVPCLCIPFNTCHSQFSDLDIGIDEEALSYELTKRLADDFHAEAPQYFKDVAKSISQQAGKILKICPAGKREVSKNE